MHCNVAYLIHLISTTHFKSTILGGICCHWIPVLGGRWRITSCVEEELEIPKNSEDKRLRAIPSPCFGASAPGATVKEKTAEDESKEPVGAKLNDLKNTISKKMESTMKDVSISVKGVFNQQPLPPRNSHLSSEIVQFRERYIVPLAAAVSSIGKQFQNAPAHRRAQQVGDDGLNTGIGWLVRRELCAAFFTLLLHGMKRDSVMTRLIVGRAVKLTLWTLIKEVSLACAEEPVLREMVSVIQKSPFLFDDDLRARNFVCEALNWQNEALTEKLLVTWFRSFLQQRPIIDKYFEKGSVWKKPPQQLDSIANETFNCLGHLNRFRFTLHADFELKELGKRLDDQGMAFLLQREPADVDLDVISFE